MGHDERHKGRQIFARCGGKIRRKEESAKRKENDQKEQRKHVGISGEESATSHQSNTSRRSHNQRGLERLQGYRRIC